MKEPVRTYERREYPKLQQRLKSDPFREDVKLLINKCIKMMDNHRLFSGICDEEVEFERAVNKVREYFKEDIE